MSIEAIAATGLLDPAALAPALGAPELAALSAPGGQQAAGGAFEAVLGSLTDLNSKLLTSQQGVAQLALGKMDNLHQVAMGSEQTRLEFELMLSARNKVLDAYQELMRMQV